MPAISIVAPVYKAENCLDELYRRLVAALQTAQRHPLLGVGTGGFFAAYTEQVKGSGAILTHNPQNEYLMIAARTGVIGLALLFNLFYVLWRNVPMLEAPIAQGVALGLVLAYLANSLFNSPLLDLPMVCFSRS